MFDFIRKPEIWKALDAGLLKDNPHKLSFQLKTMQDLFVLQELSGTTGKVIGEIGGGASRVLPQFSRSNSCYNIEPFQGADNGPKSEVVLPGVTNIRTEIGKSNGQIADATFDILFSISVVEHVPDTEFQAFFDDCVRVLKPGGVMYHAVDMYISGNPTAFWRDRFEMYRNAISKRPDVTPVGDVFAGGLVFTPDIASNPDNIMHGWKTISPALDELRQHAQSVSLKIAARKTLAT
ncbi:MAG: methyltransferase domain-containing protein [Hyphomicrobium sp.]|nr:methyltransferase domain-containing protein [Hyphomicrobium sp.]